MAAFVGHFHIIIDGDANCDSSDNRMCKTSCPVDLQTPSLIGKRSMPEQLRHLNTSISAVKHLCIL